VLRGGGGRVNYDAVSIAVAERELTAAGLPATIVVDCSHGNSNKDPNLQPLVAENCVAQILDGNRSIVGLMLESHLRAGNQSDPEGLVKLEYGLSITDPVHRLADHRAPAAQAASGPCKPCSADAQQRLALSPKSISQQHRKTGRVQQRLRGCPS
jgi:phospho-2-dehydro-3-deoxyheptonate aldolase